MNSDEQPKIEQRSLFDPQPQAGEQAATSSLEPVPARHSLFPEEEPYVISSLPLMRAKVEPCRENEWSGVSDLSELKPRVLNCQACLLRGGARGVVFGEGDPKTDIMFVGEGPGQTEDQTGRPFVGRAGQLLDLMLKTIGLERPQVFIANIVKCHPPENRLPLPPEVEACLPNLKAQIRIINPKIIVLLGALSCRTLVDPALRVTRDRGKWFEKDGRSYLVTFHPAAVLRDEQGKKPLLLGDFRSLQAKWERIRSGDSQRP